MDGEWKASFSFSLTLMGAEDNSGYFNQVWVQCGPSRLMGAEWCMDHVKGSLLTDETASLPGRVQADHTLTQCGRRSTYALFCLPLLLPVCKKRFGTVLIWYGGQHIWQSPRYSLSFDPTSVNIVFLPGHLTKTKFMGDYFCQCS